MFWCRLSSFRRTDSRTPIHPMLPCQATLAQLFQYQLPDTEPKQKKTKAKQTERGTTHVKVSAAEQSTLGTTEDAQAGTVKTGTKARGLSKAKADSVKAKAPVPDEESSQDPGLVSVSREVV